MLLSSLFVIMGLFIPQYVIDLKYNGIFFMIIEYCFIFVFSLVFLISLFMYLKCFFTKIFILDRSEKTGIIKKNIFIALAFSKLFFYMSVFNYTYYQGLENIFGRVVDMTYLLYIFCNFIFISYFYHDCKLVIKKTTPTHHWFEAYLDYRQNKQRKVIERDGKIVSIYFNGFKLNELSNSISYKGHDLKSNVFKSYLDEHRYKLNDLTDDDVLMIKMLSI